MIMQQPAIVQECTMHADPAAIFAALTEPAQLTTWWGGEKYRVTAMESDLRVGGAWRTAGISPDGSTFEVHGVYRTIDAPRLLEYTWHHDWGNDEGSETLVRFELVAQGGQTLVRVTHTGFTDLDARDGHDRGWAVVLDSLRHYVEQH